MVDTQTEAKRKSRLDDWVWHKDQYEQAFGKEVESNFLAKFPQGKQIAVVLTFDTQGDVDGAVAGFQSGRWPTGDINWCDLSMRQYDVREGYKRVLRILRKHGVPATFPVTGRTAEWYPEVVREIQAQGHEIAVHGYHHVHLFELTDEEERAEIERATAAVQGTTGLKPAGWRSPRYSITTRTLDILRDFGYTWNSDLHNQERPYYLVKAGRPILEIPAGLDDWGLYLLMGVGPSAQMGGVPNGNYDGVLSSLLAEFDVLYEESLDEPTVFQLCMHPKITGHPFRAAVLDKLVGHISAHSGVWFCTCSEMARICA